MWDSRLTSLRICSFSPSPSRKMGDAATGVWLLIGSISGYMGLLQLGLSPALTQFAAAHIARRDDVALGRTVSTAMALVLGLGSIPLLALPAVPWMLDLFSIPPALRHDAAVAFTLGIIGVPLQMPGRVFNAVLNAGQRQDRCTQVWMFSLTGKLVGISTLLWLGYGLAEVMWLETGLDRYSRNALFARFSFAAAPGLRLSPQLVTREDALQLMALGGWLFLSALCSALIEGADRVVIGLFLAIEFVTYYSAAWKLFVLVYSVSTTLVQAVGPVAAALHAHNDIAGIQRLWLRMTRHGGRGLADGVVAGTRGRASVAPLARAHLRGALPRRAGARCIFHRHRSQPRGLYGAIGDASRRASRLEVLDAAGDSQSCSQRLSGHASRHHRCCTRDTDSRPGSSVHLHVVRTRRGGTANERRVARGRATNGRPRVHRIHPGIGGLCGARSSIVVAAPYGDGEQSTFRRALLARYAIR